LGVSLGTVVPADGQWNHPRSNEAGLAPHRRVHVLRRPAAVRRCGIGAGAMKKKSRPPWRSAMTSRPTVASRTNCPVNDMTGPAAAQASCSRANAWRQLVTVI
jgi:hypothetical protein